MSDTTVLPKVEKAMGVYFDPMKDEISLNFESGGKHYIIPFRAAEIFKAEEWFIKIRQHLGAEMKKRRAASDVKSE